MVGVLEVTEPKRLITPQEHLSLRRSMGPQAWLEAQRQAVEMSAAALSSGDRQWCVAVIDGVALVEMQNAA